MSRSLPIVALLFVFVGCSGPPAAPENPDFVLPETGSVQPWTHDAFDAAEDKFTFAIHSDLTGGERDDIYEVAIAQMSLLRPEFIINVGDLIEGGTEDVANINSQWDSFDERARRAKAPLFYVGGNHDRTGQVMQDVWQNRLGPGYYHFRYKDTLFLVLDTEDNTAARMKEINDMRNYALPFAEAGIRGSRRMGKVPGHAVRHHAGEPGRQYHRGTVAVHDRCDQLERRCAPYLSLHAQGAVVARGPVNVHRD
jgi:predicted phosphodiesterase